MDGAEQLIRSDKGSTGYRGVRLHNGRYQATCKTSPCHNNHLGNFDTPERAAQTYLQHHQKEHPEELLQVQARLLIKSDKAKTGYKGVAPNKGRYQATCDTSPCHNNNLDTLDEEELTAAAMYTGTFGTFGTSEEASLAYMQHWEVENLDKLKKERASPLKVQAHLLLRSYQNSTGYKGVQLNHGRYQTVCSTPPCRKNHMRGFGTPEEAAQVYLQHREREHPEELKKDWFRAKCHQKRPINVSNVDPQPADKSGSEYTVPSPAPALSTRQSAAAPPPPPPPPRLSRMAPGWESGPDGRGGTYYFNRTTGQSSYELPTVAASSAPAPPNIRPTESAGKASDPVAAFTASHPRAPKSVGTSTALSTANNRGASLLQMRKKRQLQQSMTQTVHLSVQLADANQALKRCKKESAEADHADVQQMVSAVAQCSICCDTMTQASTVSGCGHTFCRSCIQESVTGCCPECHVPAWQLDTIMNAV